MKRNECSDSFSHERLSKLYKIFSLIATPPSLANPECPASGNPAFCYQFSLPLLGALDVPGKSQFTSPEKWE